MNRKTKDKDATLNAFSTSAEADWFAKIHSGSTDPDVEAKFSEWLKQNPKHQDEFERCELIWELSKDLKNDPEISPYLDECNNLIAAQTTKTSRTQRKWRISMALVASLLVFVLAAVLISLPTPEENYATIVGEQRLVTLADGSSIALNTDTQLSVLFTKQQRSVSLSHGEALFSVAKDSNRPFIVHAANGTTRAVGTRFNILLQDNMTTVSVLEGIVEVSSKISAPKENQIATRLTEGQAVNYYDGMLAKARPADLVRIEAWRAGKLDFESSRLIDVINEHNRYTTRKIVIADDTIKNLLVSGIFRIGENDPLIFALENSFDLHAIDRDNVVILVAGKQIDGAANSSPK
ncbi:MAG: FecR family protein [Pseudomonadales bacterium]|nr:FecR family protein [Pseudomonadales bacterium]